MSDLGKYGLAMAMALCCPGAAFATIACSATASDGIAEAIPMFDRPNANANPLREIPVDDLVVYPQEDLAPQQVEGWAWVRHDPKQSDIWQSGDYGWLRTIHLTDCG